MSEVKYHIHISSKNPILELKLNEVWQYRDLILLFTKKNFTVSYKQTILGPAWIFISPLLSSFMYMFFFGGLVGLSTDSTPKLLFYLSGTAMWGYFSSCLTGNASTFVNHANLFGKVYFPRLTIPISNVISAMVKFGIQLILLFAILVYYVSKGMVRPNLWACPVIVMMLLHIGILGMSVGIMISSLTTKYRDLSVLVTFGVQFWMYMTPVVYPLSHVPKGFLGKLISYNPVTVIMELFRFVITGTGTFSIGMYVCSWLFTLMMAMVGIIVFNVVERNFMDTV